MICEVKRFLFRTKDKSIYSCVLSGKDDWKNNWQGKGGGGLGGGRKTQYWEVGKRDCGVAVYPSVQWNEDKRLFSLLESSLSGTWWVKVHKRLKKVKLWSARMLENILEFGGCGKVSREAWRLVMKKKVNGLRWNAGEIRTSNYKIRKWGLELHSGQGQIKWGINKRIWEYI